MLGTRLVPKVLISVATICKGVHCAFKYNGKGRFSEQTGCTVEKVKGEEMGGGMWPD